MKEAELNKKWFANLKIDWSRWQEQGTLKGIKINKGKENGCSNSSDEEFDPNNEENMNNLIELMR